MLPRLDKEPELTEPMEYFRFLENLDPEITESEG